MMIRVMRLLSRSHMRMLAVGGGGGGHGSTVNLNNRRWASSSAPPGSPSLSSELINEAFYERNSSTTVDDALVDQAIDFVMEAKHAFQNEPEKFVELMTLLGDFRDDRIDLSVVKEVMMELLKGHNNLIWKFNNILPPEETPIPLDDDGLPFKYDSTAFRDDQE